MVPRNGLAKRHTLVPPPTTTAHWNDIPYSDVSSKRIGIIGEWSRLAATELSIGPKSDTRIVPNTLVNAFCKTLCISLSVALGSEQKP